MYGRTLIPQADEPAPISAAKASRAEDRSLRKVATFLALDRLTNGNGGCAQVARMLR